MTNKENPKPNKLICENCIDCAGTEPVEIYIGIRHDDKPVKLIRCIASGLMWREESEQQGTD